MLILLLLNRPSKANGAAVRLARFANSGRSVELCLYAVPDFLIDVIFEDKCNSLSLVRGRGISSLSQPRSINNNGNSA